MMQVQMQHGLAADAAPGPDEDLPAVYVAYHDWEHYFSIRNLTGVANVVERPPPDEMVLNEPPSPPPSQIPSAQPAKLSLSSSSRPSTTTRRSTRLKTLTKKNVTHDARALTQARSYN
ncbi:hypothetical protein FRC04_005117 [Tulasnella sp. 424]|nr:hypothetical protein FRC04_005117 [Tulasnella sp. 424]